MKTGNQNPKSELFAENHCFFLLLLLSEQQQQNALQRFSSAGQQTSNMARLLLLAFLLFPHLLFAQESPVTWDVVSAKKTINQYTITLQAEVAGGWHVYATDLVDIGIEGLQITWDNENIKKVDNLVSDPAPATISDAVFDNRQVAVHTGKFTIREDIVIEGEVPAVLKINLKGYAANNETFLPLEESLSVTLEGGVVKDNTGRIKISTIDVNNPAYPCGDGVREDKSIWIVFLLGLGGGLIALLTPCVFPMIPVTVSFFTNRASSRQQAVRNGVLYGFFIFLIYVAASIPFHIAGNVQPEIFNNISTNAWLNVLFFAIFIVFAISFFGYFDITLPSGLAGKVDARGSLGSLGGIFFMALTLVIVSFSCTGVILGTLLVGTASDGAWPLTAGMAGFGTALALPFALFAIFPNWLKSLPRSGGWLDTVKKVLAFLELGLAFKFLSNADLVEHWGLLKREVFIGLWILIALGMGAYLFGWLRLPHDYKGQKISVTRKVLGALSFIFALYMIPGLTNTPAANLKLLSGFPPPLSYSIYGESSAHGKGVEPDVKNDYEKALQLAKDTNKPLLIDFTGWACVNCRKMEEQVWTDPEIAALIRENYILVSLYVDDRQKLPAAERFTYQPRDGKEKEINTIGDMWATFQSENFTNSAQPLYAVISPQGKLVTNPVGYTPGIKKYKEWLECGLKPVEQ